MSPVKLVRDPVIRNFMIYICITVINRAIQLVLLKLTQLLIPGVIAQAWGLPGMEIVTFIWNYRYQTISILLFSPNSTGGIQKNNTTGNIEFYNSPNANVLFTSSTGNRIGLIDSTVINEIGNGIPIFLKTGYPSIQLDFMFRMILTPWL